MHLPLQILASAQIIEKAAYRTFKPYGLTPAQFNVLNLLAGREADNTSGMRASDLARQLIVDRSNVTGLIKRMKKEGLLLEIENLQDRRQHVVGLTPKGREAWAKVHGVYEKGLAALDAAVPARQRQAVAAALKCMEKELA